MAETTTVGHVVWFGRVDGVPCRILADKKVNPWVERYENGEWHQVENYWAQLRVFQHAVTYWDQTGLFDPSW